MRRTDPQLFAPKRYFILNAAALLAAAGLMALLARSGGFSLPRIALIAATLALALAAAAAAIHLHVEPARARTFARDLAQLGSRPKLALAVLFLFFWCLAWYPPQYTGDAYYYFIALYPLILCGLIAAGSALLLLLAPRLAAATDWWSGYFRERRPALRIALIAIALFGILALLVAQFRILSGHEPYWYGAGVPLLAAQVLLAAVVAALASSLEAWRGTQRFSADVLLFMGIWIVAAILWASRPVPANYWVTAPRAPNFEYYPFSDLITYDVASQFALIGQGIYNHMFFDRALYMSFLVYLHTIGGQNYQQLMSIQAALFAVFPALLYLIGKDMHSRAAGLALATLTTLRGLTSLDASAWIDTATFKHMLTDFPTAISVAGLVLLFGRWLRAPRERRSYLLWACGILGLASLLRPHVLLLMAASLPVVLWVLRPHWTKGIGAAALGLLAFLVGVLPWMTFGPSSGSLVTLYGDRIKDVIAQRFPRAAPAPTPQTLPVPTSAAPTASALPEPTSAPSIAVPTAAVPTWPASVTPPPDPGPPFVVDHFLHNLLTSALIFPDTPQFLPVRAIVKEGQEFWRPRWTGGMSALAALMLILSLLAVTFGIGTAVQRESWRGLVPLAVMLLYVMANSFARTSGGRYIVPVDWILIAYFCIGLAEVVRASTSFLKDARAPQLNDSSSTSTRRPLVSSSRRKRKPALETAPSEPASRSWIAFTALLLVGGMVPLAGVLYPARYATSDVPGLLQALQQDVPQVGRTDQLVSFLQQPDAELLQGRVLYPLFYHRDEGEPTRYAPYTARGYPRTVFMLIGPHGIVHVLLPGDKPTDLPNAADAIVLGCIRREQNYALVDALAVALPGRQTGLTRTPAAALRCPLPEPVCDNNGNCQ